MSYRSLVAATLASLSLQACAVDPDAAKTEDPTIETEIEYADSDDSASRPTRLGELAEGTPSVGTFGRTARFLSWTFTAEAGETAVLDAADAMRFVRPDPSYRTLDPVASVYRATAAGNPTGRALAVNDDYMGSLASHIEFAPATAGRYVLVVRRYDYGTTGNLQVTLARRGRTCGTRGASACPSGQYCDFALSAMCGATDRGGQCRVIPTACSREFAPVCGCDGSTYSNRCNANSRGVSVASEGACGGSPTLGQACGTRGTLAECGAGEYCARPIEANCGRADAPGVCAVQPEVCTEEYAPVCGCDGTTYSNACNAAGAGVSVDYIGECRVADCRSTGCGTGTNCQLCWTSWQCIPNGAVC